MKAIHLICHPTSLGWQDLQPVPGRPGVFISKCWIIREGNPLSLKDGWLYLHETSYRAAGFAARILNVEPCCTSRDLPGYAFTVKRIAHRSQRWRGKTPNQTRHHGGIVDANFTEERDPVDML
jgi:hypothetical protein